MVLVGLAATAPGVIGLIQTLPGGVERGMRSATMPEKPWLATDWTMLKRFIGF